MNEQKQDDQLEPTYNCSVPIQDVALKTYREQETIEIGGQSGPGGFAPTAWHDDDDDDEFLTDYDHHHFGDHFFIIIKISISICFIVTSQKDFKVNIKKQLFFSI